MLWLAVLAVPPNTPISTPVSAILHPTLGLLTGVEVYFRDGCLDAVGIRILERGRQLAPMPDNTWLRDNNNHIAWSEYRRLEGSPYELAVEGYSIALDWTHTIDVKFYMSMR